MKTIHQKQKNTVSQALYIKEHYHSTQNVLMISYKRCQKISSVQKDLHGSLQEMTSQSWSHKQEEVLESNPSVTGWQQCQQKHRSEEHTSELQSRFDLVCRLLLEKKKKVKIFLL